MISQRFSIFVMTWCWTGNNPLPKPELNKSDSMVSQGHTESSPPEQNGRHFANDIFSHIFLNGNVWISIKISLKFVPKGSIDNNPVLVQIMAWHQPGDKPLSEPVLTWFTDAYMKKTATIVQHYLTSFSNFNEVCFECPTDKSAFEQAWDQIGPSASWNCVIIGHVF